MSATWFVGSEHLAMIAGSSPNSTTASTKMPGSRRPIDRRQIGDGGVLLEDLRVDDRERHDLNAHRRLTAKNDFHVPIVCHERVMRSRALQAALDGEAALA
jgi:hypothetical protein